MTLSRRCKQSFLPCAGPFVGAMLMGLLYAPEATACATCFAGADTEQTMGLNIAIGVLLGALTLVLLLFGGVAWGLSRHQATAESHTEESR